MRSSILTLSVFTVASLAACSSAVGERHESNSDALLKCSPVPPDERPPGQSGVPMCPNLPPTTTDPLANAPASFALLIVAPAMFKAALAPLVAHKNAIGMPAFVATMEDIRKMAPSTVDDARHVKDLIAIAQGRGARYVMLAGDTTQVPARNYTVYPLPGGAGVFANALYLPTDFYYANLFADHQSDPAYHANYVADWDADHDGLYNVVYGANEVPTPTSIDAVHFNPDNVDAYPDIAVGRVPAGSASDVTRFVNKVIRYENGTDMNPLNAGTFGFVEDANYGSADGIAQGMADDSGVTALGASKISRLGINYGTNPAPAGWTKGGSPEIAAMFNSARWINYVGHGGPRSWDGWGAYEVAGLANTTTLPIVFASACDSGQFAPNVPDEFYLGADGLEHYIRWNASTRTSYDAAPGRSGASLGFPFSPPAKSVYDNANSVVQYMGWYSLLASDNGAIAYIGSTQTTQDTKPAYVSQGMLASYATKGKRILGDMFLDGQRDFWKLQRLSGDYFTAPRVFLNYIALQGDPSLRVQ